MESINKSEENKDPNPATSTPENKTTSTTTTTTTTKEGVDELCCLKYKVKRPSNLAIQETLGGVNLSPECSPVRSPFPSNETLNDDSLLHHENDTPKASCYFNSGDEIGLGIAERKIICLLRHFGLSHLAFIFIEQEIDVDLFLTLSDEDLQEIGIERKTDRRIILSVIAECNKHFGF